jgi:hypothetical protein
MERESWGILDTHFFYPDKSIFSSDFRAIGAEENGCPRFVPTKNGCPRFVPSTLADLLKSTLFYE